MNSDYLKFMEEHCKDDGINLFEKVLVTAKRAKSIYELDEEEKLDLEHKPTFQAILETNEGRIRYQRPISSDEN
jgi:DNA-directed RNA polymerase subunit K/omega